MSAAYSATSPTEWRNALRFSALQTQLLSASPFLTAFVEQLFGRGLRADADHRTDHRR